MHEEYGMENFSGRFVREGFREMTAADELKTGANIENDSKGPIIRINPYELHIDDLEFYDELYAGSTRKREK